jgi:hypothetical protein
MANEYRRLTNGRLDPELLRRICTKEDNHLVMPVSLAVIQSPF